MNHVSRQRPIVGIVSDNTFDFGASAGANNNQAIRPKNLEMPQKWCFAAEPPSQIAYLE